jgi:hypothetical protein
MIPQPFVKGAGERVFFGPYEYPQGADLIFDFGNPLCTSAFNSSRIVYNVGSANVTGSLIAYNNPGPIYPTLTTSQGGVMVTREFAFGSNYLEFDYSSSAEQTDITIFAMNGAQLNPWSSFLPSASGNSSMQFNVYGNTVVTGSATLDVTLYNTSNAGSNIFNTALNVDVSNGRNGYNVISVSANSTNDHKLYINPTLISTDTTTINRANQDNGVNKVGLTSNMRIMAYLQYPKVLTPKEIRQVYKVFSQRFFA